MRTFSCSAVGSVNDQKKKENDNKNETAGKIYFEKKETFKRSV